MATPQIAEAQTLDPSTQSTGLPTVRSGRGVSDIQLDGILDESAWRSGQYIEALTMLEPIEGGDLVGTTEVFILADAENIVIGVLAHDPDPSGIVSYSNRRDASLSNEDYIKLVLDPFLDGRSGFVFAVNPRGARFDALVSARGGRDDPRWDGIWEAATSRSDDGWAAEIRIPLQSLTFNGRLREWGFNIERRTERLQEVSRWASPIRDAKITQTSRAGRLTDLPQFTTGLGLTLRPAVVTDVERQFAMSTEGSVEPSLDMAQRIGPNVTLIGTVNTDFAETEVDTRRTNLTRFNLFFPEKRTFFLEGSDIFDFGLGLSSGFRRDIVPFFSRRIGLKEGEQVPIVVGGKVNGKVGNTNVGALATHTGRVDSLVAPTNMGAVRVRQNIFRESTAGIIATVGDPAGAPNSYLVGADFTYQTSRLWSDKNFLIGVWGLVTNRDGLTGDRTAFGGEIDYPNDTWDIALTYKRIGDGFDPSLGFVPRRNVQIASAGVNYRWRPERSWLRFMFFQLRPTLVTDLDGRWESYRVFTAPVNWRFESGERFEFNIVPQGERLVEPFEIAEGVVIPPGTYNFTRYRLEGDIASKRKINGRATWWFGRFFDGALHQIELRLNVNLVQLFTFELNSVRNIGSLPAGDFTQQLYGGRVRINFFPDLDISSLVQYDNESRILGTNTRVRWTFNPYGDIYVVYNYNALDETTGLRLDSNQLLVKVQYAFRY